ncbi:beta-ketoacyl synthase N-terminal-like domain-containing protein [Mycobacteroides abscessus]|uniref:type I polyketide synthase n=1 Tax=Mycobacteroides abscessus TaxID=36809 RepID=UPI0034CFACAD
MEIDVTGIACRFPGADGVEAFWDMLLRGRNGTRVVPEDRWWADDFVSPAPPYGTGKVNTRHGAFIDDPERFDHGFFGIAPSEAAATDIQQRLVLQAGYHALEDAGLDPQSLRGSTTGVFVGVMSSDWGALHLTDYAGMTPQRGVGNGYCMLANRVSYALDLTGPSMSVDTACSSSLTAVHLAAGALRAGECDLAIVAGVNLMLTPILSIFYTQAGLSAPDGRCRPFAKSGGGIGRGEGVGAVVLRRSEDRPDDAPAPYATVRGSFVGQDGRSNGITAPTRRGQERVIAAALRSAGHTGADLHFVEAHGTGTTLGDLIETQALGATCGDRVGRAPLVVGSVKGNIGHTEGAAGIAGFIKACLSMHHRTVPPSLFADDENPALDLAERNLKLAVSAEKLPRGDLLAGVSSFGLGGTNVHVVIGSAPRVRRPIRRGGIGVLTVSGNDAAALRRNLDRLVAGFDPTGHWPRYCYSTNQVKAGGTQRIALVTRDGADLAGEAEVALHRLARRNERARRRRPRIAFVYTGQGSQYREMGLALREQHSGFAEALAEADALLEPHFGGSVVRAIETGEDHLGRSLDDTVVAQPALFALQYALTTTFAAHGVRPDVVLGHSVGEIAACAAAGVLDPAAAAALVVTRGALMGALPAGGTMLAARLPAELADEFVSGPVALAAVNGPDSVTFSGPVERIAEVADQLNGRGVHTRELVVSHAFHSPAMEPVGGELAAAAPLPAESAGAPIVISSVTGTAAEAADFTGDYWRAQLLGTVDFLGAARTLADMEPSHIIEIGPRSTLLSLLAAADLIPDSQRIAPVPGAAATGLDFADALAALWQWGLDIDWRPLYAEHDRVVGRLPGYVFADEERFFASAATAGPLVHTQSVRTATAPVREVASVPPADDESQPDVGVVHRAVIRVLADVGGHREDALHAAADLRDDLGFDSVQAMQFADRIVNELDMPRLDPVAIQDNLTTIADLTKLVAGTAGVAQPEHTGAGI